jgi:anaerobic ribonucleoside-triphosphate reductase activating protein
VKRALTRPDIRLNLAATCVGTGALGPGFRSVAWVQGCPFRCRGCLAPEWIPDLPAQQMDSEDLAGHLLSHPEVDGLTLSGGEPMAQAAGLAETVRLARTVRDITVICFTGYRLDQLTGRRQQAKGVVDLLAQVDVLIDGPYVAALDNGQGLRGSTNQRVHHLTGRLSSYPFETAPRAAELRIGPAEALMVGVPPPGLLRALDHVTQQLQNAGLVTSRSPAQSAEHAKEFW